MTIKVEYIPETTDILVEVFAHRCKLCGKEETANCNNANCV